jgi:hypothetical protein
VRLEGLGLVCLTILLSACYAFGRVPRVPRTLRDLRLPSCFENRITKIPNDDERTMMTHIQTYFRYNLLCTAKDVSDKVHGTIVSFPINHIHITNKHKITIKNM